MQDNQTMIQSLIDKAKKAQQQIENYTQEQIDEVCVAIGWEVYKDDQIKALAELAVKETNMGNVNDKITKHKNKVLGVLKDIQGAKSVGLIETDVAKKIRKYAKPVGVIGALTPVTNPTATPASNAITILKGRNAVIFAPHPKSKNASKLAVDYMRQGLKKVGAPEDLIQIIETPSVEATNLLMQAVDVVLATGGGAMVKAAYSSGTPAYGVGPGNAIQIIADDADIDDAAAKVILSKKFDYATSCSSENSLIIQRTVYARMIESLVQKGAVLLNQEDRLKLEHTLWPMNAKGYRSINPKIIAQSATSIAKQAGIDVPEDTQVLMVEGACDVENDFYSQEKLSPVLTLYQYDTFDQGYQLLKRITDHYGMGHSCGIHTHNQASIDYLGTHMKSSRIMVNQAQAPANGGAFFNGMPSTVSLGCGTWGGNITTENIYYKHFLNITWVSEFFEPIRPSDDDIFGALHQKYPEGT